MEDSKIVALYHARSESAIAETAKKYGAFCLRVALNLLGIREDADECVNDTYMAAWTRMPPELPASLRAFLGRITRNLSISRYRQNRAQKRYAGMDALLSELDDCVPSPVTVEQTLDSMELTRQIETWLGSCPSANGGFSSGATGTATRWASSRRRRAQSPHSWPSSC